MHLFLLILLVPLTSAARQCYFCIKHCRINVTIQNCASADDLCIEIVNRDGKMRSCMNATKAEDLCERVLEESEDYQCWTCDQDLCNTDVTYYIDYFFIAIIFIGVFALIAYHIHRLCFERKKDYTEVKQ